MNISVNFEIILMRDFHNTNITVGYIYSNEIQYKIKENRSTWDLIHKTINLFAAPGINLPTNTKSLQLPKQPKSI